MPMLITLEEYKKVKHKDMIPLCCDFCKIEFLRKKSNLRAHFYNNNTTLTCSIQCQTALRNIGKRVEFNCTNCNKLFSKTLGEVSKSGNNFCSSSCAATYNNKNKKHGTRRSKLEKWLEEQLTILYPDLEIHYNRKDTIGSELDIYIPSLNLAIELNGIFHYEPIYGKDKLLQIQNNDNNKFQQCYEHKINLCIIDASKLSYFKPNNAKPYLDVIISIIDKEL